MRLIGSHGVHSWSHLGLESQLGHSKLHLLSLRQDQALSLHPTQLSHPRPPPALDLGVPPSKYSSAQTSPLPISRFTWWLQWLPHWSLASPLDCLTHCPHIALSKAYTTRETHLLETLQQPPAVLRIKFKLLAVPRKALSHLVSHLGPHPAAPGPLHTHGLACACPLPGTSCASLCSAL